MDRVKFHSLSVRVVLSTFCNGNAVSKDNDMTFDRY